MDEPTPSRRRLLGALGVAGLGGLAGCMGYQGRSGGATPTEPPGTPTPVATTGPGGVELPVPRSELVRGAGKDAIPAITEPAFGTDWEGISFEAHHPAAGQYTANPRLGEGDWVVGIERDGEARAYPLLVLNWHEVVNDEFGGPLLVTYCPLCGSAMAAERRVDGEETVFGVSGLLYKNDLVMYDEKTGSLWSQIMATAINGPRTGERLSLVPAALTTWGEWKAEYPDSLVLRPPPESNTVVGRHATRDYDRNPYAGYTSSRQIGIGGEYDDERLHPKTQVIGVATEDAARAYPLDAVLRAGVVNDTVGDRPVVVTTHGEASLVAYIRTVDGETLTFERDGDSLVAGGSRWNPATGVALDGPHEGTRLEPANDVSPMFFFAWKEFRPETSVYGA
ncbi:DUF3179 domain-containing protein [Natronomonas sp. EA1]|uniref:DUF3179 domain-containing protein n=1 Tax=Natronomonas sp. EA1 TaxID=3421655 RepID=UPI003EB9BE41